LLHFQRLLGHPHPSLSAPTLNVHLPSFSCSFYSLFLHAFSNSVSTNSSFPITCATLRPSFPSTSGSHHLLTHSGIPFHTRDPNEAENPTTATTALAYCNLTPILQFFASSAPPLLFSYPEAVSLTTSSLSLEPTPLLPPSHTYARAVVFHACIRMSHFLNDFHCNVSHLFPLTSDTGLSPEKFICGPSG
jgi:hypothetical protein